MATPRAEKTPFTFKAIKGKLVAFVKSYPISIPANAVYLIVCLVLTAMQISAILNAETPIFGNNLNDFSAY